MLADLLSVVIVRLGEPGSANYTGGMLDMLATLLSRDVSAADKMRVLQDECGIAPSDELESEVALMGSFAEHIYLEAREAGLRDGREEGRAEGYGEGRMQGHEEGRKEGLAEGRVEGMAAGREEGLAQGREEGLAKGLAEGLEEDRREGHEAGRAEEGREYTLNFVLRALVLSTGWDLERAMDALSVPTGERPACREAFARGEV